MTDLLDGRGSPLDFNAITLRCGTKIYRACFSNKQAELWFTTTYPNIDGNPGDAIRISDPKRAHTFTYSDLRLLSEAHKAIGEGRITKLTEDS